ncbi:amino acid adenylation domain-containing protein [Mycobacterium cookii]|nr:amino acid adenylation domain-containing protein [Mycobacterium cookii]
MRTPSTLGDGGRPTSAAPTGVVARVQRATRMHPHAIAVSSPDGSLSYEQLWLRALALAGRLEEAGVRRGDPVALCLPRSIELVVGALGVLAAGGCYVALDPHYPDNRLQFMLRDSGAQAVVARADMAARIGASRAIEPMQPAGSPLAAPVTVGADEAAYIVYTSGSTGRPKGVIIEHAGLANLIDWHQKAFGINKSDRTGLISSPGFDAAVWEIWPCLAAGASLHVPPEQVKIDPLALRDWLLTERITTTFVPTPLCAVLIALEWPDTAPLRVMLTGGDVLHRRPRPGLPFQLVNNYGVSEATVVTTSGTVTPGASAELCADLPTLGSALPGVRLTVVDPKGRPLPPDTAGELVIGGIAVGRGYLSQPDLNRAKFFVDAAGCRHYRTGDLVRLRADGQLVYLGRLDEQVHIRGLRIELGEIAAVLDRHPTVSASTVVAVGTNGDQRLCAYVVGEGGRRPAEAELRHYLLNRLPEYMVPSAYVHLQAFPTTANGKLDKAALPAPPPPGAGFPGAQRPRNNTERRVAQLWAAVLGVPVIDINSDFFDMGGHSLLVQRLISEAQRTFNVQLPLAAFLEGGRTIAGLAELLSGESLGSTIDVASGPPVHFIFADHPSAMSLRHFTAQWGAAQPLHALVPDQRGGQFDQSLSIEHHASQALSDINNRQPDGPLALVGYSIGGLLAYEIARQAVEAGRQVDWLCVLDTEAPSMQQQLRAQLTLRWQLRRLRQQPARQRWAKYAEVALRILRGGPSALWPKHEFDYRGATEIVCRYQQPGHEVPMQLFVTEASAAAIGADLLGWDEFHRGSVTVKRLVGDHATLIDVPQVAQLAEMMLESLNEARDAKRVARHS